MLKQEVSSLVTPAASEMFSGHEGLVATVTDRTDTEHFLYHRKLSWTAPLQRQENKIQAENHWRQINNLLIGATYHQPSADDP